ncbi:FG-GAP-like repeat-containing protein, partial [Flavobacteriaceae bacterium]|nr:FG-GAP-like repeat-containing protein [Flavobacteriaceae bacterium]
DWNGPDFETHAYFQDLNNDGFPDLIFGDYGADAFGRFFNIRHVSDPVYLTHDGSFNFKSRYNKEINNSFNKSIIHSPNIKVLADLNNNGVNEIINFGEDYHIQYPPHHPHVNYIHKWFETKGLNYGTDYHNNGKKTRYYSIEENGELIDQVAKIDISLTSSIDFVNKWGDQNVNYLRNMYASTVGDIDNDGDLDLISSGQNYNMGYSFDILKNDGNGNFVLESQYFTEDYNTSEGHMLVLDIDNDQKNDLIFGGQQNGSQQDYSIFGLIKGDGSTLDFENLIVLDKIHPSLGLRSIYYEDINGDDIKELIAYFTNGFGCNGCGLNEDDIPNIIKIYKLVGESEGYIKDISNQFFSDSQNNMNFYTQTSFLQYLDLDGDGYKDLIPKFYLEDPEIGNNDYPGNAFRGNWNNSKGFQYFKFNSSSNMFEIIDLGQLNDLDHYNNFDFFDLNNDKSLEWVIFNVFKGELGSSLYIYEYFFDSDSDGVFNILDNCPDTPEGSTVDVNGCPVFTLPLDNNKVSVTSASCIGNTDGSIGLSIEDESYNYTVTVTGQDDPITLGGETKTASVTGLGTGTYTVCFKVDGQDTYEQCFEVSIAEPKALSAFIDVDNDNKTTSIQLSGSSTYNVEVNGERYEVKGDRFTTNLPTGLSIIKISTDLDCQGIIEREVFISEDIHYYPNPTQTDVNVHVSGDDTLVQVSIFSEKGDLIYSREQQIQDFSRKTNIDLSRQITGTYIVVMEGKTVRKTFKIIKK